MLTPKAIGKSCLCFMVCLVIVLVSPLAWAQEKLPFNADTTRIMEQVRLGNSIQDKYADSAIIIYEEALKESEQIGYANGINSSMKTLTELYANRGLFERSIATSQKALVLCSQSKSLQPTIPVIYNCMGGMYKAQGKYEQAAKYYYQSIAMGEKYNVPISGGVYNNLAGVLMVFGKDKEALYNLDKADSFARLTKNYDVLGYTFINKGLLYSYHKEWQQSQSCFEKAIEIGEKHNLLQVEYLALTSIGGMYTSRNMPEKALFYLLKTQTLKGNINPYYQDVANRSIGELYYQLHNYKRAEDYYIKALNIAQAAHLDKLASDTHLLLTKLYVATGAYKQAYNHQQAYLKLKDSTEGLAIAQNIDQLEIKYKTAQKDKEIVEKKLLILEQKHLIKQNRFWIGCISIGSILLIGLLGAIYRSSQHKNNLLKKDNYILQQEKEINQLQAMMKGEEKERTRIARELHDGIGGMLVSIKMKLSVAKKEYEALGDIQKLDDIMLMVTDTSSEVRKTAHNLMPDVLVQNNLTTALVMYCDNINASNELEIELQFYGDIDQLDKAMQLILYRIIQELIQNVIKHAQATHVVIQVVEDKGKLTVFVEDNGKGFNISEVNGGYGLQNLRYRVQALLGELSITSEKGKNTMVYIEFDIEKLKQSSAV